MSEEIEQDFDFLRENLDSVFSKVFQKALSELETIKTDVGMGLSEADVAEKLRKFNASLPFFTVDNSMLLYNLSARMFVEEKNNECGEEVSIIHIFQNNEKVESGDNDFGELPFFKEEKFKHNEQEFNVSNYREIDVSPE
jgi:hypothetical protein